MAVVKGLAMKKIKCRQSGLFPPQRALSPPHCCPVQGVVEVAFGEGSGLSREPVRNPGKRPKKKAHAGVLSTVVTSTFPTLNPTLYNVDGRLSKDDRPGHGPPMDAEARKAGENTERLPLLRRLSPIRLEDGHGEWPGVSPECFVGGEGLEGSMCSTANMKAESCCRTWRMNKLKASIVGVSCGFVCNAALNGGGASTRGAAGHRLLASEPYPTSFPASQSGFSGPHLTQLKLERFWHRELSGLLRGQAGVV